MNGLYILLILLAYFGLLLLVARMTSRRTDNDTFFRGNRQSPWQLVAFGMIGASLSGVTFVSVPGMVTRIDMTYLQMCMGFFFGYLVIAHLLLPLYYRLNLTSIYTYLGKRLGRHSYRTGASFFLLSKLLGPRMPHPPAFHLRRLRHSVRRHRCRDGRAHLAVYPPVRHTHHRLD